MSKSDILLLTFSIIIIEYQIMNIFREINCKYTVPKLNRLIKGINNEWEMEQLGQPKVFFVP